MAFKMKGSPHKMGTMEGTSAHTSALKAYKTMKKYGNDAVKFGSTEGKSVPNKMKSPMEQMCPPGEVAVDKDGNVLQQKSSPNKQVVEKIKKGVKKAAKGVKRVAGKVKEYLEAPRQYQEDERDKAIRKVGKHLKDVVKPKKGSKGEREVVDTGDNVTFTGKGTKTSERKRLFGGKVKKEVTSTHKSDLGEMEDEKTTTSKKTVTRRSGKPKKVVTVDDKGTKTITKYDKKGNVKKVKTKEGKGHVVTPKDIKSSKHLARKEKNRRYEGEEGYVETRTPKQIEREKLEEKRDADQRADYEKYKKARESGAFSKERIKSLTKGMEIKNK